MSAGAGCSAAGWAPDIALAAARCRDLPRRGPGPDPAGAPDRPDPRRADPVGRLAGGDGGGVQLRQRHPAPLLHGGTGPGDRRAASASAQRCCGATDPMSVRRDAMSARCSSPRCWPRCCWRRQRRLAAVAACRRRGRGIGAAVLLLVVGPAGARSAAVARRSPSRPAWPRPRRYTVATAATPHSGAIPSVGSRSRRSAVVSADPAGLLDSPHARARPDGDAGRPTPALHVGGGGRRLQQRRGISTGGRRAGDGGRRVQRHRPRADARGVPAATSPTSGSTTSSAAMMIGHRRPRRPAAASEPPTSPRGCETHYTPITVDGVASTT